jgi:flavin-dependent dehydrogenase
MFDCDVLIVGGGPAGSTAAAALARAGRRVILLERDQFPRFHIGESLLASVNDVLDVEFTRDSVTATVAGPDGSEPLRLRARAMVDASGRAGILARRFALRIDEPDLANVAIFSHYAGVPRADGRRAGDIRIVARRDLGWFWMIPISDELMSVGAVLPQAAFKPLSHVAAADEADLLTRLIAETPAVARLMADAERRWPVRVERDFSYGARAYAGDRWIAVGDAGSFLDPVFSTGVAIAMESGLEGARAIDAGLARGTLARPTFRTFERRQRERYLSFRRFVRGFYTREFRDLFFSPDPPERIFRSVITVFAGYWRPSIITRLWVVLFFLSVRLQARLGFTPSHLDSRREIPDAQRPQREAGR